MVPQLQAQEGEPSAIRSVAGIQLGLKSFQPADSATWHRHDGGYGCLMLSGEVRELRRGARDVELGPGDWTWRPPLEQHSFLCGSMGAGVLTFEIPESLFGALPELGPPIGSYRYRRSGMVIALGHLLRAELSEEAGDSLTLESLLFDFLGEAIGGLGDLSGPVTPAWLERVRDRLHDEKDRRLSLTDVADDAEVHPVHLARTFRHRFGVPLGAYHRRLRLDAALCELAETDRTLADISLAAGFYDQSHFSNAVKRAVGASPGLLRRLCRSSSARLDRRRPGG